MPYWRTCHVGESFSSFAVKSELYRSLSRSGLEIEFHGRGAHAGVGVFLLPVPIIVSLMEPVYSQLLGWVSMPLMPLFKAVSLLVRYPRYVLICYP